MKKFFISTVKRQIPPIPPLLERAGGWASTYASGVGVTGGLGGTVHEFSDWEAMRLFAVANLTTPMILVYSGPDFNGGDVTVDWSDISAQLANKTIIGTTGQWIQGVENKFSNCQNIIVRNLSFRRTYSDLTVERDALQWRYATGIWVDHCTFDGEGTVSEDMADALITDGSNDITKESDLITVSNCVFRNCNKTVLIGGSDSDIEDRGKLRVTFDRCYFFNCYLRTPFVRFGIVHLLNCLWDLDHVPTRPFRVIQSAIESKILVDRCHIVKSRWLINDSADPSVLNGVRTINTIIGTLTGGSDSPPFYVSANLRPELVTFDPELEVNYVYNPLNETEVQSHVLDNCGAILNLEPIV